MTDLDQRTLVALRQSIEKWEGNAKAKTPDDYLVGPDSFALCDLFYYDEDCVGCPVADATGHPTCEDTPYFEAEELRFAWFEVYHFQKDPLGIIGEAARANALAAARKEADFLRALWPAGAVIDDEGAA